MIHATKPFLDRIIPLNEDNPSLIAAQGLPYNDASAMSAPLREAFPTFSDLPEPLQNLFDTKLLPGLRFHFVEEIKRDGKARDGLFYRLFYALLAGQTAQAEEAKRMREAIELQLDELYAKLDDLPGFTEFQAWQEWTQETLTHIAYGVDDMRSDASFLRKVVEGGGTISAWNPRDHAKQPSTAGHCFGRDDLANDLIQRLTQGFPAPLMVYGGAGIGKSTLARFVLRKPAIIERYAWRRFWVSCDTASDRATLAALAAQAAGLPEGPDPEGRLLASLQGERTLIALDNLETPLEGDQNKTEEFLQNLAGIEGVTLVVTIRGDRPVGGIAWDMPVEVEPLDLEAARLTFLAIAGKQYAADPNLDKLLEAVGRVPTAVSLLAYQVQKAPDLTGLRDRWNAERTTMLRRGGEKHRLTDLEFSFDFSLNSPWMTEDARRLLRLLAMLPGDLALHDIQKVMPHTGDAARTKLNELGLTNIEGNPTVRTASIFL